MNPLFLFIHSYIFYLYISSICSDLKHALKALDLFGQDKIFYITCSISAYLIMLFLCLFSVITTMYINFISDPSEYFFFYQTLITTLLRPVKVLMEYCVSVLVLHFSTFLWSSRDSLWRLIGDYLRVSCFVRSAIPSHLSLSTYYCCFHSNNIYVMLQTIVLLFVELMTCSI